MDVFIFHVFNPHAAIVAKKWRMPIITLSTVYFDSYFIVARAPAED